MHHRGTEAQEDVALAILARPGLEVSGGVPGGFGAAQAAQTVLDCSGGRSARLRPRLPWFYRPVPHLRLPGSPFMPATRSGVDATDAFLDGLGLGDPARLAEGDGEVFQHRGHVRMVGTEGLLVDLQGALEQRNGVVEPGLGDQGIRLTEERDAPRGGRPRRASWPARLPLRTRARRRRTGPGSWTPGPLREAGATGSPGSARPGTRNPGSSPRPNSRISRSWPLAPRSPLRRADASGYDCPILTTSLSYQTSGSRE